MKIVVLKFGGTSVGDLNRIKKVSKIIISYVKKKYKVIVVSSAMSGVTNDLIIKSKKITQNFDKAEYDVLVSSGEQISCALISGYLKSQGYNSKSYMGWQVPIITDLNYSDSKITKIKTNQIMKHLKIGGIAVVAGFQGVNIENRVTTLGRGASDYSAILLSKYFKAKKCVIYTDVEGVMTTDPKLISQATKIKEISYEEMLEMSSLGSKVMQTNSVQDARLNRIDVHVRSSFTNRSGTLITKKNNIKNNKIIRGISFTKNDAKITLVGVKDRPGIAASIFEPLSKNNINVDMVVQNISANGSETDITFTVKNEDLKKSVKTLKNNNLFKYKKILVDDKVSKVSII